MRMWMINPKILCKKHLLGEHGELHKHRHTFEKRHKKDKYIENNCIEPMSMEYRHKELVAEFERRGYNHKSPFEQPDISYLPDGHRYYIINKAHAAQTLFNRCEECYKRFQELIEKGEIKNVYQK